MPKSVFALSETPGSSVPDEYPLLKTPVPHRDVPRLPRRCRRGWRYPRRCEWRRICRTGCPPLWHRRWRLAFVGPHVARPVRVTLRRTNSRRRDRHSRDRHQRDRDDISGQAANKSRHRRPPKGPVPDLNLLRAYARVSHKSPGCRRTRALTPSGECNRSLAAAAERRRRKHPLSLGVSDGTRTRDIPDHNLTRQKCPVSAVQRHVYAVRPRCLQR